MSPKRSLSGTDRRDIWKRRRFGPKNHTVGGWIGFITGTIIGFFRGLYWWWTGNLLNVKLQEHGSETRTEAQFALDRVVLETQIPPDCVEANVVRGGPTILVKHDGGMEHPGCTGSTEVFIGNTYHEAADKAIEWINAQGEELITDRRTAMSRKEQKVFNAKRRQLLSKVKAAKRLREKLN